VCPYFEQDKLPEGSGSATFFKACGLAKTSHSHTDYLEYKLSDLQTLGLYHQAVVAGYLAAFEGNVPATEKFHFPLDAGVRLGVQWAQEYLQGQHDG
jgi:hypothetical protein